MSEPTTMTLTIEDVKAATSKSGRPYWTVRANGQRYFCWEAAVAERLQPGTTYACRVNGTGDYPKLLDAEPIPQPSAAPEPTGVDKDRLMLRMSCLRGACDVYAGTAQTAAAITALAAELEAWALR
jgi:hypothetical protein